MGYPQVSFGGLFSTIGDPTSFVSRDNRSYELYDNVMLDRGDHHLKFGGYLFRLRVQSGQSRPTRAATSPSTASGPATRSPTSCSAIRASSQVGIGRADEHGRSTWLHVYGQDDWKVALEPDAELRAAVRDQRPDDRRRQSAVGDRSRPGGRFVIASDDNGQHFAGRARRCCRRSRFRYVDVEGCRLDARAAAPELSPLRAARSASSGRSATTARPSSTPGSASS